MKRLLSLAATCLALAAPASAQPDAKPPPPPIRAFDIPTLEKLGREIYEQDTAAWVATDALREQLHDLAAAHLIGWLVEPSGAGRQVRFLRDLGSGPEVAYDIDVDAQRHSHVSEAKQGRLTDSELAAFTALQTSRHNVPGYCRPGYNSVVARDIEGDGWLVWLLAPEPKAGAVPIGGHYRFTISADGKTMVRRDALFATCLVMEQPTLPPGSKPAAMFVSNVVSLLPTETHVFLQLQRHQPMYVIGSGGEIWKIDEGHIADQGKAGNAPAKPGG